MGTHFLILTVKAAVTAFDCLLDWIKFAICFRRDSFSVRFVSNSLVMASVGLKGLGGVQDDWLTSTENCVR